MSVEIQSGLGGSVFEPLIKVKLRLTGLFLVFTAACISGSRCQEHSVCLGLEKRTSPRYSDRTLRQSTTLHSFTIK